MSTITFQDDLEFQEEDFSLSLLDMALKHGIPHSHSCGRCARCSTCQVEIVEGENSVMPRNALEENFARENRLEPNVRLACQTYLSGDVTVCRRVREDVTVDEVIMEAVQYTGSEMDLGILFCDIREFTQLASRLLPYDTFHILNRYYHVLGDPVLKNHGYIHQYSGDGIMALFGFYARQAHQICLDAVSAGLEMIEALNKYNAYLRSNFGEEIEIGIGIHFGRILAGKIGHPKTQHLTVVGDVVNVASRIQDATKQIDSALVISDSVYWELGATVIKVKPFKAEMKGKPGEHLLYQVQGFVPGSKKYPGSGSH